MATQGCYLDVLRWRSVGSTQSGLGILYKRYYRVLPQVLHQAEYDVAVSRGFFASHPRGFVLVVDVGCARRSKAIMDYVRCVNNLSDPAHNPVAVHVVNSPAWARAVWRLVRRFLDRNTANTVVFEHMRESEFSHPTEYQLYTDLCAGG